MNRHRHVIEKLAHFPVCLAHDRDDTLVGSRLHQRLAELGKGHTQAWRNDRVGLTRGELIGKPDGRLLQLGRPVRRPTSKRLLGYAAVLSPTP